MLAMSLSLHFIGIFLLGLLLPACQAFEFDLPSTIPTNEPITIRYRRKFDGSDETRWLMNITDVDGSNPDILNDGEIYEATDFWGFISVTIDREGPFRLRAVNPDFLPQRYATSPIGFAIDFNSDGSGTDGDDDGDGTGGNGSDEGTTDSDDDVPGGSGGSGESGSGTDPEDGEDPDDDSTSSPSPASPRPSKTPIGAAKQGVNTGLIAGCIAAGVAVLLIILALLFWFRRAKDRTKPGRPLTFYRDRMIRAPTPPPPAPPIRISEPMSVVQNPHDYGHAGMAYLPGYGPENTYPYGQPHSASSAVGPPVMREFILRSPRMPASPSSGQPHLKEFILRSPRGPRPVRESLAYSKP